MPEGFEIASVAAQKNSLNQRKPRVVAEIRTIQSSLVKYFGNIKDPRVDMIQILTACFITSLVSLLLM